MQQLNSGQIYKIYARQINSASNVNFWEFLQIRYCWFQINTPPVY